MLLTEVLVNKKNAVCRNRNVIKSLSTKKKYCRNLYDLRTINEIFFKEKKNFLYKMFGDTNNAIITTKSTSTFS